MDYWKTWDPHTYETRTEHRVCWSARGKRNFLVNGGMMVIHVELGNNKKKKVAPLSTLPQNQLQKGWNFKTFGSKNKRDSLHLWWWENR